MITPRSEVRAWVKRYREATGTDSREDLITAAVDHVLDQDDLVGEIVAGFVRTEVNRMLGNRPAEAARKPVAALRQELDHAPTPIPAPPPPKRIDIFGRMLGMTGAELVALADSLENELVAAAADAAFVRKIADEIGPDRRVRDRYTRDDLLRIKSKLHIKIDTRVYLGDRLLGPVRERVG